MIVGNTEFLAGITVLVVAGVLLRSARSRPRADEEARATVRSS